MLITEDERDKCNVKEMNEDENYDELGEIIFREREKRMNELSFFFEVCFWEKTAENKENGAMV